MPSRPPAPSFREWLVASAFSGSPTAFARAHRLPRTTVQSWTRGGRVGRAHRERLRAITGVDFAPAPPRRDRERVPDERARRVERLVRQLGLELSSFTAADAQRRDALRARLDARVAHRVANLLLLLLDERRYAEYRELNRPVVRTR